MAGPSARLRSRSSRVAGALGGPTHSSGTRRSGRSDHIIRHHRARDQDAFIVFSNAFPGKERANRSERRRSVALMRPRSVLPWCSIAFVLLSACETPAIETRIGEARRLSEQGLTQLEHDDLDTATRLFQQARLLATRDQDLVEEARALNGLGLCLEARGQFPLALESYERAEALNREAERPEEVLIARLNRANCLAQSRHDEAAIELAQQALEEASDLDNWHRALAH